MLRFLHAADLHLDSPLRGLERYEGAPVDQIRGATRRALENLVALAVDEKVHFVVLVGDLYDGDWRDYNTGLFFSRQMSRLREAGIRVVRLRGNHDAASEITRHLKLPDNVIDLPHQSPDTVLFKDLDVAIHGQGFAEKAVHDNLAERYPEALEGVFNIGMLHTSLSGREGHEPYAPCSLDGLVAKGYGYWALGHVHQQEVVHREPWIVFPGNSQGRHIRETGPKGCMLVKVAGDRVESVEPRELDVMRWGRCAVDARGARDAEAVLERTLGALQLILQECTDRPLAVRVEVHGACRAHAELHRSQEHWVQELRARAVDLSSGRLWLEKVRFETRSELSLEQLLGRDDVLAGLMRSIQNLHPDDPVLAALQAEQLALRAKLPAELLREELLLDVASPEQLRAKGDEMAQFLLARLMGSSEVA